jgi:hypothetical protein
LSPYGINIDDDVLEQFADSKKVGRLMIRGSLIGTTGLALAVRCSSLHSLSLSECSQLTGQDLLLLRNLPMLRTLDLSKNQWLRDEDLRNLRGIPLRKLKLVKCRQLSNNVCIELKTFPLFALDISHCVGVTSAALQHLAEIDTLRELAVSRADTKEDIAALSRLSLLFTLRFYQSNFQPGSLKSLRFLPLIYFELYHCNNVVDSDIVELVSSLENHPMQRLVMNHCPNITGAGLTTVMTKLPKLAELTLHHADGLRHLSFLQFAPLSLRIFDITWCGNILLIELEELLYLSQKTKVKCENCQWLGSPEFQFVMKNRRFKL